jgi:putative transposase
MTRYPAIRGRSSDLRKGRVSEVFACYSITKVVLTRMPLLATEKSADVLFNSWKFLREDGRIKLFAFCVMPDHFHLAFCLMPGHNLSSVMESTSKFTSRELNKLHRRHGRFWQEGFHDHRCRDETEVHDLCLYIEHNPVRRELVAAAEFWPYSSAFPKNKHLLDRDWWP